LGLAGFAYHNFAHYRFRKFARNQLLKLHDNIKFKSPEQFNRYRIPRIAEMAPTKKAKKSSDGINSRLALVMKSGKGALYPSP